MEHQDTTAASFKAQTVKLTGSNLIEASAGTGKTYSIAIMVLRLLLEKEIPIDEILMVTFTKAAVAELEERIRKFIREAHRAVEGETIDNPQIKEVIEQAETRKSGEEIKRVLHSALINLDETAVMTIHGFCQQSLNEFAFETDQLFGAELVTDITPLIEAETQNFWRENVTVLPVTLLNLLTEEDFNQTTLVSLVKNQLDGKPYFYYDGKNISSLHEVITPEYVAQITTQQDGIEFLKETIYQAIATQQDDLSKRCSQNKNAQKSFAAHIDTPPKFLEQLRKKIKTAKYVKKLFPELCKQTLELEELKEKLDAKVKDALHQIYAIAIREIIRGIAQQKTAQNLMSFDDMIVHMHTALKGEHREDLKQKLRQKYRAVFIDEFQDTDRHQYEIFKETFQKHDASLLFYIGDPKQSIYEWRKADIETYFEARQSVHHRYTMNINYRSHPCLVNAFNSFFLPEKNFDPFCDQRIPYIAVRSSKTNQEGFVMEGQACTPITLSKEYPNKSEIAKAVARQILALLTDTETSLYNKNSNSRRGVKPSDIGILVRSKMDAEKIKKALSQRGIPSVSVGDKKILKTEEARELVYVLEGITTHTRSAVNRALSSVFTDFTPDKILTIDEDRCIQQFRSYHQQWRRKGVYAAVTKFIDDFNLLIRLKKAGNKTGERILTNLHHLLEILSKAENQQQLGPQALIDWLKISIDTDESTEDEMIQRIESDEEAVSITTIHSSKGLEYNIVFAPYLDMKADLTHRKDDIVSLKMNLAGKSYVSLKKREVITEGLSGEYEQQKDRENRRLLYVALTRAVYTCFIYQKKNSKSSALKAFTDAIEKAGSTCGIAEKDPPEELENERYSAEKPQESNKLIFSKGQFYSHLKERHWALASFTQLAAKGEYHRKEPHTDSKDSYDRFTFKDLPKGAKTGNFIHHIFEKLDFSNSNQWDYVIDKAVKGFAPRREEAFRKNINTFLEEVLATNLLNSSPSFCLSQINLTDKRTEMEFNFPLDLFTVKDLENLRETGVRIKGHQLYPQKIEGLMTGFIDLFFRYNEKYYILDWKTNSLGSSLSDYSPEAVENAMTANNYHLQYLIYTYAVKKYLTQRLGADFNYKRDFGGVFYLFVRGMRRAKNTGIFYAKPSSHQISLMEEIFEGKKALST